jgi:hypothetical protein
LYYAAGIWGDNGGHVFNQHGKIFSPFIGWNLAKGWNKAYWKANPGQVPTALSRYSLPHLRYGSPGLSTSEAAEMVSEVKAAEGSARRIEIGAKVEQRLEDLGYRT